MSYRFISYRTVSHCTRCNTALQIVHFYDILAPYLWGYKGGRCVCDGRTVFNCRGGSKNPEQGTIHGAKTAEKWALTGVQARQGPMDDKEVRPPAVLGKGGEVPQTRGTLTRATLAFPPVAEPRLTCNDWNPIQVSPAVSCYLQLLSRIWQGLATYADTCKYRTMLVGSVRPKGGAMPQIVICPVNRRRRFVFYRRPPCRYPRCVNASCTQAVEQGVHLCERHFALSWRERMEAALAEQYSKWTPTAPEVQG